MTLIFIEGVTTALLGLGVLADCSSILMPLLGVSSMDTGYEKVLNTVVVQEWTWRKELMPISVIERLANCNMVMVLSCYPYYSQLVAS